MAESESSELLDVSPYEGGNMLDSEVFRTRDIRWISANLDMREGKAFWHQPYLERGPSNFWFHVPSAEEREEVSDIVEELELTEYIHEALHLPKAGKMTWLNVVSEDWEEWYYLTRTPNVNWTANVFHPSAEWSEMLQMAIKNAISVRWFKNNPVVPTTEWVKFTGWGDDQVPYKVNKKTLLYLTARDASTSDTVVIDKSNHHNNATWYWSPSISAWSWAYSDEKLAFMFNWSNWLYCDNKVINTSSFTISLWYYPIAATPDVNDTLISNQNDNSSCWIIVSHKNATWDLYTIYWSWWSSWEWLNNTLASFNEKYKWYHLVVTVNWNVVKRYVDWFLVSSFTWWTNINFANATNLSIWFLRSNWSTSNFRFTLWAISEVIIEEWNWNPYDIFKYYCRNSRYYCSESWENESSLLAKYMLEDDFNDVAQNHCDLNNSWAVSLALARGVKAALFPWQTNQSKLFTNELVDLPQWADSYILVSAWVMPTAHNSEEDDVIAYWKTSGSSWEIVQLYKLSPIKCGVRGQGTTWTVTAPLNKRTHIMFQKNKTSWVLYVNWVKNASATQSSTNINGKYFSLWVSAWHLNDWVNYYFKWYLKDVKVWSNSFTQWLYKNIFKHSQYLVFNIDYEPTENTLCYLPLISWAEDWSQYNRAITPDGAIMYDRDDWALFPSWSSYTGIVLPNIINSSNQYTISWRQKTLWIWWQSDARWIDLWFDSNNRIASLWGNNSLKYILKASDTTSIIVNNAWVYNTVTISNWMVKIYINWALLATWSIDTWKTCQYFRLWQEYNNAYPGQLYWYIREFIIETWVKELSQISDNYNNNKWKYLIA